MSNLKILEQGTSASGLTKKFVVQNTGGVVLGYISWQAHWRRYWFTPMFAMGFDAGCLFEIGDFCIDETEKHWTALKAREEL
jgi:hypothetical protein